MPVLGIDFKRPNKVKIEYKVPTKEESYVKTETKTVKAYLVHPSETLPTRNRSREVINSVKRDGVKQAIIVRPHPRIKGQFEIIEGWNRYLGVIDETPHMWLYNDTTAPDIEVKVHYGLTDAETIKLAYTLHKRDKRNTYEFVKFIAKWVQLKSRELGSEEGAKTEVAKEFMTKYGPEDEKRFPVLYGKELNAKQSMVSQNLKILDVFKKFREIYPYRNYDKKFGKFEYFSINKLYELTKLLDDTPAFVKVVEKLRKRSGMTIETLRKLVGGDEKSEKNQQLRPMFKLKGYLAEQLKESLQKCDARMFQVEEDVNELLKMANNGLIKCFIANPTKFKAEFTRDPRKGGYKLAGFKLKTQTEILNEKIEDS